MSISEKVENRNMAQELLSGVSICLSMLKEAIDGFNNEMDDVRIVGIYEHLSNEKYNFEVQLNGEDSGKFLEQIGTVTVKSFSSNYYEYSVDVGIIRYSCLVLKGEGE